MAVSVFFLSWGPVLIFSSQVLSIGPRILALLDQPTGQQTKGLAVGVPTLRTLPGNLVTKLLCEHVVPCVLRIHCLLHRQFKYI